MLKEKGITLIALVITIIVLLILAGVTLATVTGYDGILPNAQNAVNQYKEGVGNDQEIINAINALFKEYMTTPDAEGGDTPGEEPEEPITPPEPTFTTANIGDYVDIGNDPLGKENTAQNWRILDVDDDENLLLILADYLPVSQCRAAEGITLGNDKTDDSYPYSVKSTKDANTLVSYLSNTENWSGLVPSTLGATATVTGGPTKGQIEASFVAKHSDKTSWDATAAKADGLYVPQTTNVSNCSGYWLASANDDYYVWYVNYNGYVSPNIYNYYNYGVRPVVSLTSDIQFTKATSGGVTTWTIVNE